MRHWAFFLGCFFRSQAHSLLDEGKILVRVRLDAVVDSIFVSAEHLSDIPFTFDVVALAFQPCCRTRRDCRSELINDFSLRRLDGLDWRLLFSSFHLLLHGFFAALQFSELIRIDGKSFLNGRGFFKVTNIIIIKNRFVMYKVVFC